MKANFSQYNFRDKIYLLFCWLRTRVFFREARLIRFPLDIRNQKYISFGKGFTTGRCCRIEVCGQHVSGEVCLQIGENVQINDFVHIAAYKKVVIGDHVLIASKVFISDINHGNYKSSSFDISLPPIEHSLVSQTVCIGNKVWIGESACILPGVTIGEGAVVGALSCVTKSVPPYSIVVGNPARVVKKFNHNTNCWELI